MLILCNGMPRSASTWSFNVVVGLLSSAQPKDEVYSGYDENVVQFLERAPESARHAVLKCHTLDPLGKTLAKTGAARVIFTLRPVADALVSFMRMFGYGFEHSLAVMRTSIELYRFHGRTGNAAIAHYEEITSRPEEVIRRIAVYLGLNATPEMIRHVAEGTAFDRIKKKAEQLNDLAEGVLIRHERTAYDPKTLLNVNHIQDGRTGYGREALTEEQERELATLLRQYDLTE